MTNETKMVEAEVWLTLEPIYNRSHDVAGMRVASMRQTRPKAGDRAPSVRLRLRLPAAAFAPLAPTVTIEVPADALAWPEPEVTVE